MHSRRTIFDFGECVKRPNAFRIRRIGLFLYTVRIHIRPPMDQTDTRCIQSRNDHRKRTKCDELPNQTAAHTQCEQQVKKTEDNRKSAVEKNETKALKIEMEIKRSEMCKILLFFLHSISFTSTQSALFCRIVRPSETGERSEQNKQRMNKKKPLTQRAATAGKRTNNFYVKYLTRSWCRARSKTRQENDALFYVVHCAAHHYDMHCGRSGACIQIGTHREREFVCTKRISFRFECIATERISLSLSSHICVWMPWLYAAAAVVAVRCSPGSYRSFYILLPILVYLIENNARSVSLLSFTLFVRLLLFVDSSLSLFPSFVRAFASISLRLCCYLLSIMISSLYSFSSFYCLLQLQCYCYIKASQANGLTRTSLNDVRISCLFHFSRSLSPSFSLL